MWHCISQRLGSGTAARPPPIAPCPALLAQYIYPASSPRKMPTWAHFPRESYDFNDPSHPPLGSFFSLCPPDRQVPINDSAARVLTLTGRGTLLEANPWEALANSLASVHASRGPRVVDVINCRRRAQQTGSSARRSVSGVDRKAFHFLHASPNHAIRAGNAVVGRPSGDR